MIFTAEQAISAGLLTELMTVVIDDEDPDTPPIIPTKLFGSYKLSEVRDSQNKFTGYSFVVNQNYLNAKTISGEFSSTEEFVKFADEMRSAGATIQLEDNFLTSSVTKFSSDETINQKLIFNVRYGKTSIEGDFEISEGVVKIFQKPFLIGNSILGAFQTAEDLFRFVEKCLEDLRFFDKPRRLWSRQGYELKSREDFSERNLERNRNFWANPEKYLSKINGRSKFFKF